MGKYKKKAKVKNNLKKTVAIVGGGVGGLSALYQLTKSTLFSEITLFDAPEFFTPCSLNSTAIVAPRGVTAGLSVLGDTILAGYECFRDHVRADSPAGVFPVTQSTGALTKLEEFRKRYPGAQMRGEACFVEEDAWLIRPALYLDHLRSTALRDPRVALLNDLVTSVDESNHITTQDGVKRGFDHVIFIAGVRNVLWKSFFTKPQVQSSKIAQGSYLEFAGAELGDASFSFTLEGDNLVYHAPSKNLLVGSSTRAVTHELAPRRELNDIYQRLAERSDHRLPAIESAIYRTGLREKASKREPYIAVEGNKAMIGGLYKNGFTLSLYLAGRLLTQLA